MNTTAIIFFSITIFCLFLIFAGVGSTSSKQPPHRETQNSKHDPLYVERMEEAKHQAEERGDLEAIKAIEEDRYDQLMQKRAKRILYILKHKTKPHSFLANRLMPLSSMSMTLLALIFAKASRIMWEILRDISNHSRRTVMILMRLQYIIKMDIISAIYRPMKQKEYVRYNWIFLSPSRAT